MRLFTTDAGLFVLEEERWLGPLPLSLDALFRDDAPASLLRERLLGAASSTAPAAIGAGARPPLESQEVWAAGVTYFRSREARMEESEREADVYDRVYGAERPELFFKATPHRVVGHGEPVVIREDSSWNVPEAELALAVNRRGAIFGYSIGNDMSSRSIEGENPLYLPQAKIYDGSCALGPCLYLSAEPLAPETPIELYVDRAGRRVFEGRTSLAQMKRSPEELVGYLFRHSSFPNGCYLLTGTGIVPEAEFTLSVGDEIAIVIEPIGRLVNRVR